jgi:hypothetical protein
MRTIAIIFAMIGLAGLGGVLAGHGGVFLWMFLGGTFISAVAAIIKFIRTGDL